MDFTYGEYGRLIDLLRQCDFAIGILQPAAPSERRAWLRHDIDMSIDDAFSLASFEEQLGVAATYHVMLDTNFYNVMSAESNLKLRTMANMGHDIGLHYVQHGTASDEWRSDGQLMAQISGQCSLLSETLGREVTSFSFHRPRPDLLKKNLVVPGYVNAYARPYFEPGAYISDSNNHWKCGDPFDFISGFQGASLQILTHPFWWNPEPVDPRRKLVRFIDQLTERHKATLVNDVGLASSAFGNP